MSKRIRTTISLPEETLEIFRRMAEVGDTSVSKCMGNWLTETADAAQMVTEQVLAARGLPNKFLSALSSLTDDSRVELDKLLELMKEQEGPQKEHGEHIQ